MNLFEKFEQGLAYDAFLSRYGTDVHKDRWRAFHAQLKLTPAQTDLLKSFTRQMNVLCLAGAWCEPRDGADTAPAHRARWRSH